MPTKIKMVYDIKGKFDANYKYEPVYSKHKTKTADTIADEWFNEIKNK